MEEWEEGKRFEFRINCLLVDGKPIDWEKWPVYNLIHIPYDKFMMPKESEFTILRLITGINEIMEIVKKRME